MKIADDILKRLARLGEDPADYADLAERRGEDSLVGFVERLEESDATYGEWSPRLLAFADECRSVAGDTDPATQSERDRAKVRIYEEMISSTERFRLRHQRTITVSCIPLIGIPALQKLWLANDGPMVILTPEEWTRWNEIYHHPDEVFWCWINYWWEIEDPPDFDSIENRNCDFTLPDGETPWLVTSGVIWGPQYGGATTDLWAWNGKEARFERSQRITSF